VGGDAAVVTGLVRAGVDPHTFNPSPADIRAVVDADLVLASGLHLEAYLDRLVASSGPRGRVIAVGDALPLILTGPGGEQDPHWWHSIGDVIAAVDLVRREFDRERPRSSAEFDRNARAYRAALESLKAWVSLELVALPAPGRQLVTSHDAFGYFAHDYGFTVHPIIGTSTESEADARHVARLVDVIRERHIRAIFAEATANPRIVRNLLEETGAALGQPLFADGLGAPGSGAETYDAMVRHNVAAIVEGLAPR
jgi:ABC-type Zn uptake system ZnuABC Zn-binding protein ZnuA